LDGWFVSFLSCQIVYFNEKVLYNKNNYTTTKIVITL
jgi:hypothetical protein